MEQNLECSALADQKSSTKNEKLVEAKNEEICQKIEHLKPLEKHFVINIQEDSYGHTYEKIFAPCFDEILTEVEAEDGFTWEYHQIRNFSLFCSTMLNNAKNLKKITLITKTARQVRQYYIQRKELESIEKNMASMGLEITIIFDEEIHDREFRFNNGWVVTIGRGLDIYKKPIEEVGSMKKFKPEMWPCRRTKIIGLYSPNSCNKS
uniref:MITD1 C-terminal phospholipase D-like domain-containing protein n=1 Tax=Acrobeloides nanus TaxID=290746 RepID=A0A914DBE3_9BILA